MRARRLITFAIALSIGAALGWYGYGVACEARTFHHLASDDAAQRERAWDRLLASHPAGGRISDELLGRVLHQLDGASNEALLHAADVLRARRAWRCLDEQVDMFERELRLRVQRHHGEDLLLVAESLLNHGDALSTSSFMQLVQFLLNDRHPNAHRTAMAALLRRADREPAILGLIDPASFTVSSARTYWLARSTMPGAAQADPPPDLNAIDNIDLLESRLVLAIARGDWSAEDVINRARAWDGHERPCFEYLITVPPGADDAAQEWLQRAAQEGDIRAGDALVRLDEGYAQTTAQDVIESPDAPVVLLRSAAWTLGHRSKLDIDTLFEGPVADTDRLVCTAALLAERVLDPTEASHLAERWIRSFDDDCKRAGALLSALLGVHDELLAEAFVREDMPAVRTTQRLALYARGRDPGPGDPKEFAHRALYTQDGALNADAVLCLLLAGDRTALTLLTTPPERWTPAEAQRRDRLLERFVPQWHAQLGRSPRVDPRAMALHFERVDALRLLQSHRLTFDAESGTFTPEAR